MLSEIEKGFKDKEVYLSRILGMDILMALLEHGRNLRVIFLPSSVYEQTSERVKTYMREETRVSLQKRGGSAGRPVKYTEEDVREVVELWKKKVPVAQISRDLSIPKRTLYYLLKERRR